MLLDPREISPVRQMDAPAVEDLVGVPLQRLWYVGDPALLRGSRLSIVSGRGVEASLARESIRLVRALSVLGSPINRVVGGWHAPLEREAFQIFTAQRAKVIFCLSKGLAHVKLTDHQQRLLRGDRVLLLTHCTSRARRMTRAASLRRNKIVLALGRALLILGASPGSAAFDLATLALGMGKPVFALHHEVHEKLFLAGATRATVENIASVLSRG